MPVPAFRRHRQDRRVKRDDLRRLQESRAHVVEALFFLLGALDQQVGDIAKSTEAIRVGFGTCELTQLTDDFLLGIPASLVPPGQGFVRLNQTIRGNNETDGAGFAKLQNKFAAPPLPLE